jgi:hypothetical protein
MAKNSNLAEGAGFEPAMELPPYTLSRRAPSTARPPLRAVLLRGGRRRLAKHPPARNAAPSAQPGATGHGGATV